MHPNPHSSQASNLIQLFENKLTSIESNTDHGKGRPDSDHDDGQELDDSTYLVPPPFSLCCLWLRKCKDTRTTKLSASGTKETTQLCSTSPNRSETENWCMIIWKVLANGVSLFVFLGLLSYLPQAFPAIAISYYLSPTSSLIRLGFFEVAAVVIIMEIAYLLFLVEKLIWLLHVYYTESIPEEILYVEEKENEKEMKRTRKAKDKKIKYIYKYLLIDCKVPKLRPLINSKNFSWSCKWLLVFAFAQIITFICVIYLSWKLLYFLMTVVIDQTSDPNDQFRDILAILPTIALNGWLLFKQGNIIHVLKDVVSKANKTTMEHKPLSEHVGSGHPRNYGSIEHYTNYN